MPRVRPGEDQLRGARWKPEPGAHLQRVGESLTGKGGETGRILFPLGLLSAMNACYS